MQVEGLLGFLIVAMPVALGIAIVVTPVVGLTFAGVALLTAGALMSALSFGEPIPLLVVAAGVIVCGMAGAVLTIRQALLERLPKGE